MMLATKTMFITKVIHKIEKKCLKTAEKMKNRRIQPKYRANNFGNGFIALPVAQNHMIEKIILNLSPIGKKLGGPYHVLHLHLGFKPNSYEKMRIFDASTSNIIQYTFL